MAKPPAYRRDKSYECLGHSDDVLSPWPFVVAILLLAVGVYTVLKGWGPGW